MSRYQDAVIDDDDESCPLCIEEFDLGDKNFKPCPCGYQICQFCFHSLKNTYDKSTCPNCRRPYDESTIQYKIPTAEELKLDQLNKSKRAAAAKRKETEKREVEASSRRNLAGVRVKQQNLVYVIGLEPTKKDETSLMETLRGKDYFGQYGPIEKVVVSKPKPGALNQGVGVYVTFKNKDDAAMCISCVDGTTNGDKILRAQYGTTKYCSTYLRGDICQNKNCSFLHENGEDGQTTSLQNEPIDPRPRNAPARSQPTPQPTSTPIPTPVPASVTQPMARENSREGATSRQESVDGSALPPSVGWANTPAVARARRGSQAASTSTASPQLTHATLAHKKTESIKQNEAPAQSPHSSQSSPANETKVPNTEQLRAAAIAETKPVHVPAGPFDAILDNLKSAISNSDIFPLTFDDSSLSPEVRAAIAELPPLFDHYGGAKRRVLQNKQIEYQAKLDAEEQQRSEEQAKSAAEDALDEDNVVAGSLALGGEPEENPRSASARGAIGRPPQQSASTNLPLDQLSNLSLNQGRSLTPQQRQQMAMLNTNSAQGARLHQQSAQNTAFDLADFDRRGPNLSQAQYDQMNSHARHGSRYFNNDSKSNNARFPSQQPLQQQQQQQQQQQPFYSSGIQGPPPGLPTAGTPPVSGGGMFAHGQGFTSSGFGAAKDSDNLRTRSGTNGGHDVKRGGVEHLAADPSILSARLHQTTAGQGLFAANQGKDDYPPLPKAVGSREPVHSRVSSIQSAFAQRTSTPKIPPGFEGSPSSITSNITPQTPPGFGNLHAHPPRADDVPTRPVATKEHISTHTIPVIPDIPVLPKSRKSSLKADPRPEILKEIPAEITVLASTQTETQVPREIASKQPISEDVVPAEVQTESPTAEAASDDVKSPQKLSAGGSKTVVAEAPSTVKEIAVPKTRKVSEPSIGSQPDVNEKQKMPEPPLHATAASPLIAEEASVVHTPATLSRVNTPSPKKQAEKQLKPLTITREMVEKGTIQPQVPLSTTTEKSAPFSTLTHMRQSSRQPSISVSTNVSRSSTPAASDRLMSRDVSRAGSPPPGGSVIGSAPMRSKTKNQTKKERRARKTTDMSETGSTVDVPVPPTPPVQEEVAPIVARQKKQKKQKSLNRVGEPSVQNSPTQSSDRTPQNEPVEAKAVEKVTEQVEEKLAEAVPSPQVPARPETPPIIESTQSYTLRELCRELDRIDASYENLEGAEAANNKHKEIQELILNHSSPPQKLLSELVAAGAIPKDHPLFTTPHFQSPAYKLPTDSRKGQEYLDANGYSSSNVFGMVYLPTAQKRVLYNGHAVSVHSGGDRDNDLLHRALITPNGTILRHLSADEGQKVIDLEQGRSLNGEDSGELIRMDNLNRLEDDDFVNLEGGFDELIKNSERHGVCWIIDSDRSMNARRRAQPSNRRVEDDYGLSEMPIDADEFDDEEDEEEGDYDDPDEDDIDDEEEREGEDLVNGIDPDTLDDDEEDYDSDNLGFDHITTESGMNLPSLPDMNLMNMQNTMPGSWDPSFNANYPSRHGMYGSLTSPDFANLPPLPPAPTTQRNPNNTLPPMRHPHMANSALSVGARDHLTGVNFRNMPQEALEKRVRDKQRELESSRREAEKAEKALNKKTKDAARWRESVFKAAAGIAV